MSFYYPFDSLVKLSDFVDQDLIPSTTSGRRIGSNKSKSSLTSTPRMDLIENKDLITAVVELPGLTKDKVDISLHDNVITISGSVEHEKTSEDENSNYKSIERSYGSFARSFAVPPGLKQEEVRASLENGLLKVEIPKIARESEAKKITIA